MINSEQSICPICGGELVAVSEEVLKCRHCASTFRDQSLQRKLKSIQEFLDQAKIAEGEPVADPSFYSEKMSQYILQAL